MAKPRPSTKKPTAKTPEPQTAAPSGKNWAGKSIVRCWSQADLDAALTRDVEIWLCGTGRFVLRGSSVAIATDKAAVEARGSAHVEARGSAHVEAWESARVVARGSAHVEAWESAHVEARGSAHVEARGSAHVEAWESAHVEAWGSAHVEAWESARVVADGAVSLRVFGRSTGTAGRQVVVQKHSKLTAIEGGIQIDVELPATAADWCAWHGVKVVNGVATLYKGVGDNFQSDHGADYTPGTVPVAPDWDGGREECGGGLHFSPSAASTRSFTSGPKFIACQVRLVDMRAPKADDIYPNKIKASGCCGPCVEVDIYGNPVAPKASAA